jgi:hypothetical protein
VRPHADLDENSTPGDLARRKLAKPGAARGSQSSAYRSNLFIQRA